MTPDWIIVAGLTPCPFCGNNVELKYSKGQKKICCARCGCVGPDGHQGDEARDVFERWGRRVYQ